VLIAFIRDSQAYEVTNAPHGAFFNACSFLKTGTNVLARAIQGVIFFVEDSIHHRPPTPRFIFS